MNFPTLYQKASTGKIKFWEITAEYAGVLGATHIVTTWGLVDGKRQSTVEVITEGKNIGKSNETNHRQQAEAEARSRWEKKVKKGYVESLEDAEQGKIDTNMITGGIEPMLAHSFDKQGHKIKFPAFVQPKLDGHRCIAIAQDGKVTLWSRTRKRINSMPHIVVQLEKLAREARIDFVLDGELYNHDYREKFEELTSLIRQEKPALGHEVVEYWVYDVLKVSLAEGDVVTQDAPFERRNEALTHIDNGTIAFDLDKVKIVETEWVDNAEEMIEMFGYLVNDGYEGLMVRNADSPYKNKRSYDLQKVKMMADAEYEIIDITEGRGKMAGRAMFHCVTPDGKEFRVKMQGALDDLVKYFEHKDDYIGKQLTVKYQNLSADGIPRFPIGLRVREDV